MGQFIVRAFLNYIESHPAIIEQLVEEVVTYAINELRKHNNG